MPFPPDNYGIRPDYAARTSNVTVVATTGNTYWTPYQIQMARHFQHPVYLAAKELAIQKSARSVLDIGCGPALKLAEVIAPVCPNIVGLDEAGAVAYHPTTMRQPPISEARFFYFRLVLKMGC